jgi:hypothetical protein
MSSASFSLNRQPLSMMQAAVVPTLASSKKNFSFVSAGDFDVAGVIDSDLVSFGSRAGFKGGGCGAVNCLPRLPSLCKPYLLASFDFARLVRFRGITSANRKIA